MAERRPLRIGVLGTAEIARRRLLPAFEACPDTRVTAVASRTAGRAAEVTDRFGGCPVRGYAALLERDDIDAVYLPLPAALHAEWTERALRSGRHVLAEKPLTTDPVRTRELLALAADRGLVLMENVMFVHHPQHAWIRGLADAGAIGELRSFHAVFTVPARRPGDIRLSPELGGGALLDTGVYPVRAALELLGTDLDVVGAAASRTQGALVDTGGAALLRTPAGVLAQVSYGIDDAYRSVYELAGSTGVIRLEHAFTPPGDHRPAVTLRAADGRTERHTLDAHDQVLGTVARFAAAVRAGRAPHAAVCLRQAELLHAIAVSAAGSMAPGVPRQSFETSSSPRCDGDAHDETVRAAAQAVRHEPRGV
ncbi:Gfo/Idh/MocA family protein [Streptomyces sp. NBC_00385]|uniref:Gfo/Idh/MocA family protein n=1 Tax=Streptomyces sp. NBC_00385 TaxID=2975733 RepID=UPI002DD90C52|nr:Gfo/Idh/MocA family oxidoreductase [Streptomyces sp. NBC_00385]WRZ04098.1 Gfo/Idh/MocA family oxidoreductase [Streptomyces sp. NBC_00385]